MLQYFIYFVVTYFASAIFSMGGVGSAIVLVPALNFLGVSFDMSKAAGLFVNTITTSTASFMNIKRKVLDFKFTVPFIITSMIFAPLGAYSAKLTSVYHLKIIFTIFLLISSVMMVIKRKYEYTEELRHSWILIPLGAFVGFLSGLLGIGGGALIIPMLAYMKLSPKKIAVTVSFMIPFSTFSAFISYVYLIKIDWVLTGVTTVAAVLGGYTGNRIMHFKLKDVQLKNTLALLIFIISLKMLWDVLTVTP